MTGFPFCLELAFDDHLGGNPGVVTAGLPQRVVATHAVEAGQCIHQCVLESVPHVQTAGHIRRRNHDAVGFALPGRAEIAIVFPGLVPTLLDFVGVVGFFHGNHVCTRSKLPEPRLYRSGAAGEGMTTPLVLCLPGDSRQQIGECQLQVGANILRHFRRALLGGLPDQAGKFLFEE